MKKITLLLALALCSLYTYSQTTLQAGDIAFLGSNVQGATNSDDMFAFVLLKDIESGTQIIFTDRGWDNTASAFTNFNGDGEFTWTASGAMSAGDIVTLDLGPLFPAAYALIGDQLFAIQGSIASPTFIAGLQFNEVAGGGTDGDWDGVADTNSTSQLPPGLTTGDTAVRLITAGGLEQNNWQFSCDLAGGSPVSGTPSGIRAVLHNRANWNSSDTMAFDPVANAGCSVTIQPAETLVELSGGVLTIEDINGGISNDVIIIGNDGVTLTLGSLTSPVAVSGGPILQDPTTVTVALADITAGIVINAEGGSDQVIIGGAITLPSGSFTVNDAEFYTQNVDLNVDGDIVINCNNTIQLNAANIISANGNISLTADLNGNNNGNIGASGFCDIIASGTVSLSVGGGVASRLTSTTPVTVLRVEAGSGELVVPETAFTQVNANLTLAASDISIPSPLESTLLSFVNNQVDATAFGVASEDASADTFEITDADIANITSSSIGLLATGNAANTSTMTIESVNLGTTDFTMTNGNGGTAGPISFLGSSSFGKLEAFSTNGMSQTGGITVNGNTNFANVAPIPTGNVVLDNPGNDFMGSVSMDLPGQELTLVDSNTLLLGNLTLDEFSLTTGGDIALNGTTINKNGSGNSSVNTTGNAFSGTGTINQNAGNILINSQPLNLTNIAYSGAAGTTTDVSISSTTLSNGDTFGTLNSTGNLIIPDNATINVELIQLFDSGAVTGFLIGGANSAVNGAVHAVEGVIFPGDNNTDFLTVGDTEISNGTLELNINGPTAGTDHDQLIVNGTVTLGGFNFFGGGYANDPADEIIIINNDGNDPVVGTFNGLPESSAVNFGAFSGFITYMGGDGNDVSLVGTPTQPSLLSMTPMDDAIDVPLNTTLVLNFDQPVQGGSGFMFIKPTAGGTSLGIQGTGSQVAISGSQVTITPQSNLNPNTAYHVEINPDTFQSLSGVSFPGFIDQTTWNFSTITTTDMSPPMVLSLNPPDDATNVPIDSDFVINFDEDVQVNGGFIQVFEVGSPTPFTQVFSGSGDVVINGSMVTIDFPIDLLNDTEYRIQVPSNAFEDLVGNDFAGLLGNDWTFTTASPTAPVPDVVGLSQALAESTIMGAGFMVGAITTANSNTVPAGDVISQNPTGGSLAAPGSAVDLLVSLGPADSSPPLISAFDPADDSIDVPVDMSLMVTFNENVQLGSSGSLFLRLSSDDTIVETFDVATPMQLSISGDKLTIDPTNDLDLDTEYYLTIDNGAIEDLAGNSYQGFSGTTVWSFMTVGPDCMVTIDTQPMDVELCDGGSPSFTVVASGTGTLSYQWFLNFQGTNTFNPIPTEQAATLNLNGVSTFANANQYRVVVTSDNGTPGTPGDDCEVTSDIATLTVNPLPIVTFTAPADISIDAGVQAGLGGGTPVGGVYTGPGVTDDGNGMTYSFDPAAAGVGVHTLTYTFIDGNGCENSASDDIEVIGLSSITVVKMVTGPGADPDQQFKFFFNSSIGGLLGNFYLSQSGIGSPEPEGGTFDVPGGNLFQLVEQDLPEGYDVSDIQFSSANGNSNVTVLDIPGNEIQFIIADGDDVTVTFVNEFTPPVVPLSVTNFVLVNADNNTDIMSITDGASIDLSTLPTANLNIRAETTDDVESVFLQLSGTQIKNMTENVAPYALFGDNAGNYAANNFAVGSYGLMATPFSTDNQGGTTGTPLMVNFEFTSPVGDSPLILLNADTDVPLFNLTDGLVINKMNTGNIPFGVIFNPDLNPGRVKFTLTGPINEMRTEGPNPPYSLFGDIGVNIQGMQFPVGDYMLVANPKNGPTVTVNFEVIDEDPLCAGFDAFIDDTTDPSTCGGSDGSIVVGVVNGNPPVSIELVGISGPGGASTFTNLAAGTYTIIVTDDSLCSETLEVTLSDPPPPVVTLDPFADVLDTDAAFALTGGSPAGGDYGGPGVSGGMFDPQAVGPGDYEITYSYTDPSTNCEGSASQNITVINTDVLRIINFELIDADADVVLFEITDGMIIDFAGLPTNNLNIQANATNDVESVVLMLSGQQSNTRTENVSPYALYGDVAPNYFGNVFTTGEYSLTATPFAGNNGNGMEGTALTVNFEFVNTLLLSREAALNGLSIFPNPADREVTASFEVPAEIIEIAVFDMHGRLVQSFEAAVQASGKDYPFNVAQLQSGSYVVRMTDARGFVFQKQLIVKR